MNTLRKRFKKDPVWADGDTVVKEKHLFNQDQILDSDDSGDESDHEAYAGDLRSKLLTLDSKELNFKQLCNLNNANSSSETKVTKTKLNPKYKLASVVLANSSCDLFEADGETNKFIQRIKFPRTKFPDTAFSLDGNTLLFTGPSYNGSIYTYSLNSAKIQNYKLKVGKESQPISKISLNDEFVSCISPTASELFILSSKSYELTSTIKLNQKSVSSFLSSNNDLYTLGENGQVYVWDLRKSSNCKYTFYDEGCVNATTFASTEKSNLISIGSSCGIVNTYLLTNCCTNKNPRPLKTFDNLKGPVSILEYNHTGELLLAAASSQENGIKLIHTASSTVYKNFPRPGKRFGHVNDANFSPLSGYFALGCSSGKAHLFRLPFYKLY